MLSEWNACDCLQFKPLKGFEKVHFLNSFVFRSIFITQPEYAGDIYLDEDNLIKVISLSWYAANAPNITLNPRGEMTSNVNATFNSSNCNLKQSWTQDMLTKLQESAVPVPIRVACTSPPQRKPLYLGEEYHGRLAKGDDRILLEGKSGRFIIRDPHGSTREHEYTIVFNYAGDISSLKLVYCPVSKKFQTDPPHGKQYKTVLLLMNEVLSLYHSVEKKEAGITKSNNSRSSTYQKSHNFQLRTFLHPKWCDHCKEFLWGIHNQGFRCDDCNTTVHKLCKDSQDIPCSKLEYGTKISAMVHQISKCESIDEPDLNTKFKKVGSLPDFQKKCTYFRECSQFLSAYNVRDMYIDEAHLLTKCFCTICINEHLLDKDIKISSDCYPKWTTHSFSKHGDPLKRVIKDWEVAYFPIKPKYLLKMITECFNPPNQELDIDLLISKNFEHTIQDMAFENYSHRFVDSKTGDYAYAQIVLEVFLKPGSYETVTLSQNNLVGECDIIRNHFKVRKIRYIYPKSIMIKIFRGNEGKCLTCVLSSDHCLVIYSDEYNIEQVKIMKFDGNSRL